MGLHLLLPLSSAPTLRSPLVLMTSAAPRFPSQTSIPSTSQRWAAMRNAAGIHFPGMLSPSCDLSFESLSTMSPPEAWAAVPDAGKAQILATIFIAELVTEGYQRPHYMKGGPLPTIVFPAIDFSGVSEETMAVKRTRELNNGRLAQIAIMSFVAAHYIPGSVPALAGNPVF